MAEKMDMVCPDSDCSVGASGRVLSVQRITAGPDAVIKSTAYCCACCGCQLAPYPYDPPAADDAVG